MKKTYKTNKQKNSLSKNLQFMEVERDKEMKDKERHGVMTADITKVETEFIECCMVLSV